MPPLLPPKSKNLDIAAWLGFLAFGLMLGIQWATTWEWSFLMDDVSYTLEAPIINATSFLSNFKSDVQGYWGLGRFYPVKYLANAFKWRYFPLDPNVFHAFNFVLLAGIFVLGAYALLRVQAQDSKWKWILAFIGLGFLQRPLLDVVALNSIAEGWVILFFALGLCLFPRHAILYRVAFLLCGLSKEPGIAVFAGSTLAYILLAIRSAERRRALLLNALIDGLVFIGLAILMKKAQMEGSYLVSYRLLSFNNLTSFAIGLAKCVIGLLPLIVFILPSLFRKKLNFQIENPSTPLRVCAAVFAVIYLYLVTGKGIAGYLLIPPCFALLWIAMSLFGEFNTVPTEKTIWAFALLFVLSLSVCAWRYTRYINSINLTTRSFNDLLLTRSPRLIIINGEEAVALGGILARHAGTPVTVVQPAAGKEKLKTHKGDVVLFELTTYFGPYSGSFIQEVESVVGGWKSIVDRKVYRVFYG